MKRLDFGKGLDFPMMNDGEVGNLKVPALGKAVALLEALAREPGLGFTGI